MLKDKGPVRHLNRFKKAKTIEALLQDFSCVKGRKVLDIGCGNGQISAYFSIDNDCYGVDVEDHRDEECKGFNYQNIIDEALPFDGESFDIVISHHVVEHVSNQELHLQEIFRVLKKEGVAYLACPNKSSPFMKGHIGNDMVPTNKRMNELLAGTRFVAYEKYTDFLSQPKKYFCPLTIGDFIPRFLIKMLKFWFPSHCYLLKKPKV